MTNRKFLELSYIRRLSRCDAALHSPPMNERSSAENLRGFGERLRRIRTAHGMQTGRPALTHREFAAELGIEQPRYGRYDRGEINPPLDVLIAIRRATGVSLDYLICGLRNGFDGLYLRPADREITVGERLTWVREALMPFGAEQLCRAMGITPLQWQRWEEDIQPIPEVRLAEITHRLNVSVRFLLYGELEGIPERLCAEMMRAHPELLQADVRRHGIHAAYNHTAKDLGRPEPPDLDPFPLAAMSDG